MTIYERKITQDDMDNIATYMDDEIRERLHSELAPCEPEEFLAAYLEKDPEFEELLGREFDFVRDASCITRTWKVYGNEGHRQRESFNPSTYFDFSGDGITRIIEVMNADKTGTNEFSIIRITRNTPEECEAELEGQLSDGVFEDSRFGAVEEVAL